MLFVVAAPNLFPFVLFDLFEIVFEFANHVAVGCDGRVDPLADYLYCTHMARGTDDAGGARRSRKKLLA